MILDKAGFDLRILSFFSNYLIDKRIQYIWNNFVSPSFRTDVDIEQDSTLFFILSALYIFHIFEKRKKALTSQMQTSSVVIVLFSFFLNNSVLLSNMINQRSFTFLD